MEKFDLIPLLEYIDPTQLDYQEWIDVGMALKEEGYSVNDWDLWSRKDQARYHEGECLKKWESFNGSSQVVTGATITKMAKDNGWHTFNDDDSFLSWESEITASDIDKGYKLIDSAYLSGQEIKEPVNWNPAQQVTEYLNALFEPGDTIGFVTSSIEIEEKDGTSKWIPGSKGVYTRTAGDIVDAIRRNNGDIGAVMGDSNPEAGAWIRFNPLNGKGVRNDDVVEFRYALVESDRISVQVQNEIYQKLELPIATLTYTGKKSLHAIVKINARNYPEYQERVNYLYDILQKNGLNIDRQNKNPSRLTRLPGFLRGTKKQFLVATNIGKANWDEWKEYIEDLNDNLPDMENLSDLFDTEIELAPELISGVLRQGHKMLIAGPSKAGKSFALIELAIAIAEGSEWFGFKCVRGKVLYVNLELDGRSAKKRFVDIYKTLNQGHKNIGNIDIWNLRGKTSPMDKLTPKLIRRAKDANYVAIIIDPIYKVLTGDENNAHDMSIFVNQFDKIATELGCSVIYAHHHSKGTQGTKSSIDRSSGSGVFARDPDAILDLIELPVSEERLESTQNIATCALYKQAISKYNQSYYQSIGPDDFYSKKQMSYHLMCAINILENSKDILKLVEEQRQIVIKTVKQSTAWRLEGTLREFPKFNTVNVWFRYPIHIIDDSLGDISLEDEAKNKWKKNTQKSNLSRSEKAQKEVEEAFNILSEDGSPLEIGEVAEYLSLKRNTVYMRVKKMNNFKIVGGYLEKNTDSNDNK